MPYVAIIRSDLTGNYPDFWSHSDYYIVKKIEPIGGKTVLVTNMRGTQKIFTQEEAESLFNKPKWYDVFDEWPEREPRIYYENDWYYNKQMQAQKEHYLKEIQKVRQELIMQYEEEKFGNNKNIY